MCKWGNWPALHQLHQATPCAGRNSSRCLILRLLQAKWLPEEYRTGTFFRLATRFKGAHPELKHQLRTDDSTEMLMYQPRAQGSAGTSGVMDWKVSSKGRCCTLCVPHAPQAFRRRP